MATNNHTADENGVLIGVERVAYAESSIESATATVVNVAPAREGGVTRAASATTSNRTRAEFNGNSQIIKLVNRWLHGPSAHLYTTSAVAVSQLVLHNGTEWMALADGGVKKLNGDEVFERGVANTLSAATLTGRIERLYPGGNRIATRGRSNIVFQCDVIVRNGARLYRADNTVAVCRGFVRAPGTKITGGVSLVHNGVTYEVADGLNYYRFVDGEVNWTLREEDAGEVETARALNFTPLEMGGPADFGNDLYPANPLVVLLNMGMRHRLLYINSLPDAAGSAPASDAARSGPTNQNLVELSTAFKTLSFNKYLINRVIPLDRAHRVYVSIPTETKQTWRTFYECMRVGRLASSVLWYRNGDTAWVGGKVAAERLNADMAIGNTTGYARLLALANYVSAAARKDPGIVEDTIEMNQRAYTREELARAFAPVTKQQRSMVDLSDNLIEIGTKEEAAQVGELVRSYLGPDGTLNLVNNKLANAEVVGALLDALGDDRRIMFYTPSAEGGVKGGLTALANNQPRLRQTIDPADVFGERSAP